MTGWTATLAKWRRDAEPTLEDLADKVFAALDVTQPVHRAIAEAALAVPPFWPIADLAQHYCDCLCQLDTAGTELALDLWRAERSAA